jgi:hypothetical protein
MFPASHRLGGDHSVGVVGRGYHHRINTAFLVQQAAEVFVFHGVRVLLERCGSQAPVDITQGDNIRTGAFLHRAQAANAQPNACDIQSIAGRLSSLRSAGLPGTAYRTWHNVPSRSSDTAGQETPPAEVRLSRVSIPAIHFFFPQQISVPSMVVM